jgi:integrase
MPRPGELRLDSASNAEVAKLNAALVDRSPKTVNNVLVVLNTVFKTALKWGVIEQMPATIELLKVAPSTMEFYEPHEFERLVDAATKVDHQHLVFILLGGEAGLRCGEILALEQTDVDFTRDTIHVRRSEWEGHVTLPKGGRARQVNMTARLADALRKQRHLRGERILWRADGHAKVTQVLLNKWMSRSQRLDGLKVSGEIHIRRLTFCSRPTMAGAPAKAIQELAGHRSFSTAQRYVCLSPAARSEAIRSQAGTEQETQKRKRAGDLSVSSPLRYMVGETGFEPATPWSRTKCSTRLSHSPICPTRAGGCFSGPAKCGGSTRAARLSQRPRITFSSSPSPPLCPGYGLTRMARLTRFSSSQLPDIPVLPERNNSCSVEKVTLHCSSTTPP